MIMTQTDCQQDVSVLKCNRIVIVIHHDLHGNSCLDNKDNSKLIDLIKVFNRSLTHSLLFYKRQ